MTAQKDDMPDEIYADFHEPDDRYWQNNQDWPHQLRYFRHDLLGSGVLQGIIEGRLAVVPVEVIKGIKDEAHICGGVYELIKQRGYPMIKADDQMSAWMRCKLRLEKLVRSAAQEEMKK